MISAETVLIAYSCLVEWWRVCLSPGWANWKEVSEQMWTAEQLPG